MLNLLFFIALAIGVDYLLNEGKFTKYLFNFLKKKE